jgi:DNA-directed RNA polymerase III subunit RPC3
VTYYEANQVAAYALVRQGKFMDAVETRHGVVARDLVHNLFLMGHASVADLVGSYQAGKHVVQEMSIGNNQDTNGKNGELNHNATSVGFLYSTLVQLLDSSLVKPSHKGLFRSPADIRHEVETALLNGKYAGSAKGPKQRVMMKEDIVNRLQEIESEHPSWTPRNNYQNGFGGTPNNFKRQKLANGNGLTNGHGAGIEDERAKSLDV